MGIKVCANQGADPLWCPERGYSRGHFGYLKKIFLSQTACPNALIFDVKQHWDMGIKFCANKIPGVYSPVQGDIVLYRFIYMYIANSLENHLLMNNWPACFLNWHEAFLGQGNLTLFK